MLVRASATKEVLIPASLSGRTKLFPIIFRSRRSEAHAVDYCNGIDVFFFHRTDLNIRRINILLVHAGLCLLNGLGAPRYPRGKESLLTLRLGLRTMLIEAW